jgi:hypothetical protein
MIISLDVAYHCDGDADRMRGSIEQVLADPRYIESAASIATEMAHLRALDQVAVDIVAAS